MSLACSLKDDGDGVKVAYLTNQDPSVQRAGGGVRQPRNGHWVLPRRAARGRLSSSHRKESLSLLIYEAHAFGLARYAFPGNDTMAFLISILDIHT